MKKLLKVLGLSFIVAAFIALPAFAITRSSDTVIVSADETINDDFFVSGNEIIIEGTVNGDVYAAAERIAIRGTVNGDVLAGASTLEVTGTIEDDLRAGANVVTLVGAQIGDSVSVGGNELSIDGESVIGGGVLFGGRTLSIDGSIGRGVLSGAEVIRIDGSVGRDVQIAANNILIGQDAAVTGNLKYSSEAEATIEGQVQGEIQRSQQAVDVDVQSLIRSFSIAYTTWAFLGAALVGGLVMLIFPRLFRKGDRQLREKPARVFALGLTTIIVAVPLIILFAITVVGIPLALILLILWLLGMYFAKFFVAYSFGNWFVQSIRGSSKETAPFAYIVLLFGLALYYALRLVPVLGLLIRFAVTIIGLGMIISISLRPMLRTRQEES